MAPRGADGPTRIPEKDTEGATAAAAAAAAAAARNSDANEVAFRIGRGQVRPRSANTPSAHHTTDVPAPDTPLPPSPSA